MEKTGRTPELKADWQTLHRVFIRPEDESCKNTLLKYMEQILFGLHDFLNQNVGVTEKISLAELSKDYMDTIIDPAPQKKLAHVIQDIIEEIAPRAVNVASPYFIGHMTSAIPFFMVHLKAISAALNQNVIKLETSKVLSILEKQVLAKIHRMIYGMGDKFYTTHVQNTKTALGGFTSGGTTANITALWVARNKLFPQKGNFKGIEAEGFFCAMQAHGLERVVVLVSKRGHFSLKKAGGILGLGHQNVIAVEVDKDRGIDIKALLALIRRLKNEPKTRIAALVGIAGATETGVIDPLPLLADICEENGIHFHVDAAWGGPVLLSDKYAPLLKGIERADSVSIDCHKQFYMPMTAGMVFFKDPLALNHIAYNASYIIRKGSVDLGVRSLEGSRESNSLILDASLKIMGARGYGLLIEHGIKTAGQLAEKIKTRPLFELITAPVLNILTYRLVPPSFREKIKTADPEELKKLNLELDDININIQRIQRETGKSFVSRTRLKASPEDDYNVVVLRVVIMNPMTTPEILDEVLDEQESILNNLNI